MACREENIPEVGSYIVYDIAGDSYLVVRTREGIKAYVNACLHRGRRPEGLRRPLQRVPLQLPRLHLEARRHLRDVPGACGVPAGRSRPRRLGPARGARSGTWGGFVFINPDPDGEPLEDFLGDLPDHFARWDLENRYVQAHVAKKIRCNWKVAQEAFSEGLHLGATHPQSAPYVGDANRAVDVYGNWSPADQPERHADRGSPKPTRTRSCGAMLDVREGEDLPIPFEQGTTARGAMAARRASGGARCSATRPTRCRDAELVDHWNYMVFPNLHPWGGYNRIVYRFRPNGDDHDECDLRGHVPDAVPRRAAADRAKMTELDFGRAVDQRD